MGIQINGTRPKTFKVAGDVICQVLLDANSLLRDHGRARRREQVGAERKNGSNGKRPFRNSAASFHSGEEFTVEQRIGFARLHESLDDYGRSRDETVNERDQTERLTNVQWR